MYGVAAGRLDTRAVFTRRSVTNVRDRGPFSPLRTVWAQYTRLSGREQAQAGQEVSFEAAVLRIRDSAAARDIGSGDRVTVHGRDHRIISVSLPTRTGYIEIAITTDLGET